MLKQMLYLPLWFAKAKFLGKKSPLQTVLFITDVCNLRCKHCAAEKASYMKPYSQIKEELEYSYNLGSRFVDFEGGEPTLWQEDNPNLGKLRLNDLLKLAKDIGYFSTTVTTNAINDFSNCKADAIWVSLDGLGKYHDAVRGKGSFEKLEKNIATCKHPALSVNMAINTLNRDSVGETLEYAKNNPAIQKISLNFHTPYEGTEYLMLPWEERLQVIDQILAAKKAGAPIMNSTSGLKLMKHNKFKRYCWVSNFILADGTRHPECPGSVAGVCDQCGFCMAGEMNSVMSLKPDTILAGMSLRMK